MTYDIADRHMSTTSGGTTVSYLRDATDRIISRTANGATTRYGYSGRGDSSSVVLSATGVVVDKTIGLLGVATMNTKVDPGTAAPLASVSTIRLSNDDEVLWTHPLFPRLF